MSALSSAAILPIVATPSIATGAASAHSRPDLAERFEDLLSRCKRQWDRDAAGRDDDDDPDLKSWGVLSRECRELAQAILDQPAVTFADVVLQARACALENNHLWTCRCTVENMLFEDRAYRLLIERLCEFAGAPLLPGAQVFFPVLETAGGE